MSIRKLLCGLLALCLMITLSSVALMEGIDPPAELEAPAQVEAPVEDVVLELGSEEAEELLISDLGYDDPEDVFPAQNAELKLFFMKNSNLTQQKKFNYDFLAYATTDNADVIEVTPNKKADGSNTITIVPKKTGKCAVTVYSADTDATMAIINVNATGVGATRVRIGEKMFRNDEKIVLSGRKATVSKEITGTVSKDMGEFADGVYYLNAGIEADVSGSDYEYEHRSEIRSAVNADNKKFVWKSSNESVIKLSKPASSEYENGADDAKNEWIKAKVLKQGTAKITVTASNGRKAAVTLKVTDVNAAQKITIVPDPDDIDKNFDAKTKSFITGEGKSLLIDAAILPDEVWHDVTWTLSDTDHKYCYFTANDKPLASNAKSSAKKSVIKLRSNETPIVLFFTGKTGNVKITAKSGSKTATYALKIVKSNPPIIAVKGVAYKRTHGEPSCPTGIKNLNEVDLWVYNEKAKKIVRNSIDLELWVDAENPAQDKVKSWTSSNASVATVKTYANKKYAKVTFKKTGTVSITATASNGLKKKITFRISGDLNKIIFVDNDGLEQTSATLQVGKKLALGIMIQTDNDRLEPWQELTGMTFSKCSYGGGSTIDDCISVSSEGIVTANKVGVGYVKVKAYNGKTAILEVRVVK